MRSTFIPCRTSILSKVQRYAALLFYPFVGVALLGVILFVCIELTTKKGYTVEQIIILLLTAVISIFLFCFLINMSKKSFCLETRHISIEIFGFALSEKPDKWYAWNTIGGIGIIAFAANASKQIYQTQICIFLEPVNNATLKKLRDSYLYGAFNSDKYILLDYNPLMLDKLEKCSGFTIVDLQSKQLKL